MFKNKIGARLLLKFWVDANKDGNKPVEAIVVKTNENTNEVTLAMVEKGVVETYPMEDWTIVDTIEHKVNEDLYQLIELFNVESKEIESKIKKHKSLKKKIEKEVKHD